jgi:acetyltransferase-like isoleucine patch superfamily enzyme
MYKKKIEIYDDWLKEVIMKDVIKEMVRNIIYGKYSSSNRYIDYLRKQGCTIGERVFIPDPKNTLIDTTRPYLINIGNDVKIARGVTILSHGYDWCVLSKVYHEMLGSAGNVKIGNNVFIGVNTTILKGVSIGDNVIIGANSLISKDIPKDVVYAGNPGKVIMTLEEYYNKRKNEYLNEAKELATVYFNKFNKKPPVEVFAEFFPLFLERDIEIMPDYAYNFTNNPELLINFNNTKPMFEGYEAFLKWCGI